MRIKAHTQTHRSRGAWYLLARACKYTYIYVGGRCTKKDGEVDFQSQAIQLAQRITAAALYVCVCVYVRVFVLTKETRLSFVILLITPQLQLQLKYNSTSAKHVLNFSTLLSECAH